MKRFFIFFISLFFVITSARALPLIGAYVGTRGGLSSYKFADSFKNNSGNNNYFLSANAGVKLLDFRFEAEYLFRPQIIKINYAGYNDNIKASTIMLNIYYDFFELPFINFYVNGGIGNTKLSGSSAIDKNGGFTWSTGLGVNFSLIDIINLDLGYRYMNINKLSGDGSKLHDIYIGFRFGF